MFAVKYKFTSKTGGFESYVSHQLLCGGMVEVNSEPSQPDWVFAKNQSNRTIFEPPNKPGWIYKRLPNQNARTEQIVYCTF